MQVLVNTQKESPKVTFLGFFDHSDKRKFHDSDRMPVDQSERFQHAIMGSQIHVSDGRCDADTHHSAADYLHQSACEELWIATREELEAILRRIL